MSKKVLNQALQKANRQKNDEFYTQLTDIEKELKHYRNHFKDKVVFCNCDDPRVSNFFHYFSHNFNKLGLKKLYTTCYKSREIELFDDPNTETAVYLEYDGTNVNGVPDYSKIDVSPLSGDGDFRSKESIELLKKSDIVVTNPPFSLFREFVDQLIKYDKKFLLIGNQNALTYKEVFRHIKNNSVWLGVDNGGTKWFQVPLDYDITTESRKKVKDGKKYFSMGNIYWFTNLDNKKRHQEIILYKKYSASEYEEYDNYNAINVNRVNDIPYDYDGNIGVPITFLDKYNPEQFEIVGADFEIKQGILPDLIKDGWNGKIDRGYVDGKRLYARIIIKNRRL